jgi:hypothetical protein
MRLDDSGGGMSCSLAPPGLTAAAVEPHTAGAPMAAVLAR